MKVWTVAKGEYSDYNVVAVFSSEEKAKAYVAAHVVPPGLLYSGADSGMSVEEPQELDPTAPRFFCCGGSVNAEPRIGVEEELGETQYQPERVYTNKPAWTSPAYVWAYGETPDAAYAAWAAERERH